MFDDEYGDEERKDEDNYEIDLRGDELDGQDIDDEDALGIKKSRKHILNIFIMCIRSPLVMKFSRAKCYKKRLYLVYQCLIHLLIKYIIMRFKAFYQSEWNSHVLLFAARSLDYQFQ